MSENDLPASAGPVDDAPLSNAQGEEAIGNLLDSVLGADHADEVSAQEPDVSQTSGPDEGEEDDGIVIDPDDEGDSADAPDETEFKGGRFASDDAKVKLDDGSTISIAELKRNNLFQRDYSKKTEELSSQRKQFEQERGQFSEHIDSVIQQREVILALASELLPQEPVMPTDANDPIAYLEYRQQKDAWDQKMGKLNGLMQAKQQEQQNLTRQQEEQQKQFLESEKVKLYEALPRLKDEAKRKAFLTDAVEIGTSVYGLTPQDITGISDHRYMRILADAMAYRKAIAKRDTDKPAPNAQQQRQPRIPPQQRMSAQTPQQRDSRNAFERLRQTGSARDAEAALMNFIT